MMKVPYDNYKTRVCRFYQESGQCTYGKNCTYAHGEQELRKPYEQLSKEVSTSYKLCYPNAFKKQEAEVKKSTLSFALVNKRDEQTRQQVEYVSKLFHSGCDEDAI